VLTNPLFASARSVNVRFASRATEGLRLPRIVAMGHLQTHAVQQNPTSLDNFIGAGKQHRWHGESERFGGLQVDDQLEFGRLLHWKIGRLGAFEYLVDVAE
jgi:hypothetical protein